MAQDAELRLKVSLDLAFFRQQLAGLGQVSAGYKMPVQVKFDRSSVQNELNALGSNIRRRNYFLEVKTNLKAEIKNAKDLASELSKLSSGAGGALPRKAGTFRQELTQLNIGQIQAIYAAAAKAGLVAFDSEINKEKGKIVTALNQAANDAGQGFLNAFSKQNSLVKKAAGEYGTALLSGLKKTLRIESPSREMFNIGEDAGKGFELGLLRSMELAEQSATRKMQRMLDRLARMALMMGGMSPAAIGQQAAGFRGSGISAPSWTATVPPGQAIGGGGRILPPAPIFPALSGTGGPGQKLLMGDLLDAELKEILRNAANTFVDEFRTAMNSAVRQTRVEDLGTTIRGVLPPGANPPSRPLLPAAGGTGGYFNAGGRRPGGGFVPPGGMPSDGAAQLYPSTFIGPGSSMEKFKTAIDIANASVRNFRASSIPLIGGLKEIGGEFLNATKQVLLYGTAYKGLAFITSLPGQILNAAKSQQQFSNAMQTATQDTGTFAKEMLYVDNVQRAFGLNLETTRQGFVRLYASMAPTGFDSGSIEKLFTGISAATAALQLTPDKAERVIYAFGQMASKGQIMSEELKGQLGDVLPGALALFAKAAGMSVKEFSQAMEDGEFVGQRFREVFAKVSDELMNRFGTGAQAAGKSLQGLLNTVQGDFRRTLESFAPLANAAAQSILGPLSGALKQLSMSAQLAMGEQDRAAKQLAAAQKDVKDLTIGGAKPEQIRAAEQNVAALQSRLELLNAAAADPAIAQQAKNIQAFVSEVGKAATAVMNIAGLIGNVLNPVMTFLGTNLSTVITVLTSFAIGLASVRIIAMTVMGALTLMNIAVKAAGAGSVSIVGLSTAFNVLGVSASSAQIGVIGLGTALKVLLVSTGIGALIALVTGLGAAFFSMGDSAKKAAEDARAASRQIKDAALSGNVSMLQMQAGTARANIRDLQTLQAGVLSSGRKERQYRSSTVASVTPTATQRQQAALLGVQLPQGQLSETQVQNLFGSAISGQRQVVQDVGQALPTALQRQKAMGLNQPAPMVSGVDAQEAGKDSKTKLSEYSSEAIRIQQKGIDNLVKEIEATVELTRRQKDLEIAKIRYEGGLKVADLQHAERIKDIGKLKEEFRGLARAEADRMLGVEQSSLKQEYNKAVLGDLFDITEKYSDQIAQAEDKVAGLSSATGELTEREKLDLLIMRQLQGVSEKDLPLFQARIDLARDLADKLDILNQAEKDLLQTRKLQQELDARQKEVGVMGQGLGAGLYGSAAQVYERTLLQPGATPDYARQMAQLESQAMQLESVFGSIQNAIGGVGDAFGTMMTQGITSMIQGTATAQEVFSSFLKAVGDALLQAAAQMIATYIAIGIAKAFAGMGGNGGGNTSAMEFAGTGGGTNTFAYAAGIPKFAEGGMVSGPTLGLIGEGGEPEYVIPQSKMRGAMERYAAGTRGASVIPGSVDGAGGGEAMAAMMGPIDVRYQVERINSVDYVTADQFQVGLAQAARQGAAQGEQRTLRRLQMSASTRRRVGI